MTFHDTQAAPLDSLHGADPYADFRVESPREIVKLMRELNESGTPVQMSAPGGAALSTVIWSVDVSAARLSLRADADHPQLHALVETNEVTAVAYLDAVKLQFDLDHVVLVRGTKACALQASLPTQLYRFQRRQSFRVRPHEGGAPSLRLRHPALPDMQLRLRVLDLSIAGCALLLPDDVPELRAGSVIRGVQLDLQPGVSFIATLTVHHISSIRPGSPGQRLGCELTQMDGEAERLLQRYIDQTQKRRRLLSLQ